MIVVFGAIAVDHVCVLDRLPKPDETIHVDRMNAVSGGKGATQAVAAARAGARVALAGAVGRDEAAGIALRGPEEAGVETEWVARMAGHTGWVSLLRDPKGQVQIVHALGANTMARAEQIPDAALGPDTTLVVQLELPVTETASLVRRARRLGTRIVVNVDPARVVATDVLTAADVVVVGEGIAGWLAEHLGSGVSAASLRAALGVGVVRSVGGSGLEYASDGAIGRIPSRKVKVVDETGAQDCLVALIAAGLDGGLGLEAACRRANVAAALCCERLGGQPAMPLAAEIEAAMASGDN